MNISLHRHCEFANGRQWSTTVQRSYIRPPHILQYAYVHIQDSALPVGKLQICL